MDICFDQRGYITIDDLVGTWRIFYSTGHRVEGTTITESWNNDVRGHACIPFRGLRYACPPVTYIDKPMFIAKGLVTIDIIIPNINRVSQERILKDRVSHQ